MKIGFKYIKDSNMTIGELQKLETSIHHMQDTQTSSFSAQESSSLAMEEKSLGSGFQCPAPYAQDLVEGLE